MALIAPLLDALLSPVNDTRRSAEQAYEAALSSDPSAVASEFIGTLTADPSVSHRSLAAVLLRKVIRDTFAGADGNRIAYWRLFSAETKERVKDGVLQALAREPEQHIRRKLSHVIAETALCAAGKACAEWPALLHVIFGLAGSPEASLRQTGLHVFVQLCDYAGDLIVVPHVAQLQPVLTGLLGDAESRVRVVALEAIIALLKRVEDEGVRASFQPLIPQLFKVLELALGADELQAREALQALIDLIEDHPVFIRPFVVPVADVMLRIVTHADFDAETRKLALEFLLALAERATPTMRKVPGLVKSVVDLSLHSLTLVYDDPAWASKEDEFGNYVGDESDDDDEMASVAASTLDRLAKALGGKVVWPTFRECAAPYFASPKWQCRRAAVIAMSLIVEGCKRVLLPQLRQLVLDAIPFASDAHIRVRHAALRALGQITLDFTDPNAIDTVTPGDSYAAVTGREGRSTKLKPIQQVAGDILIPAFIRGVGPENAAAPRVQAVAAASIVNFAHPEACSEDDLSGHVGAVLQALLNLIQTTTSMGTVEPALSAVGTIAIVIDEQFGEYYPPFAALCAKLFSSGTAPPMVRNKALECFGMMCEAVGREKCGMDSARLLNDLISALRGKFEKDDNNMYMYICQTIVRIASTLGADFAPFLYLVIPPLLEAASQKVDVVVVDAEDSTADLGTLEGRASMVIGDEGNKSRVAIDDLVLSRKMSAVNALASLVGTIGVDVKAFWPCIAPILEVMLPLASIFFAAVRQQAVCSFVSLTMAALANVSDLGLAQRVIDAVVPCLIDRLNSERDSEIMYTVAEALSEQARLCYESLTDGAAFSASPPSGSPGGPGISVPSAASKSDATPHTTCRISLAVAENLFKAVQLAMHDSMDRRVQSAKFIAANPDSDADDAEVLNEELAAEDDFMVNLVDTVGYVVKQHGVAIMPLVGETIGKYLLPHLATKDALTWPIRHAAICLCDDLIEFASPVAHGLLPAMLPAILDVLATPGNEATLRQAAAYGAAVCAQFGGDTVTPHAKALVDALISCVTAPGARKDDAENATDNAISAVVRFALHRRGAPGVDSDALMAGVVAYLPIKADGIEARTIHGLVIDAIANMDEVWLGKGMSRLPAVLKGLADGLVQHHLNTDSGAAGAADEDEDGTSGEELFDDAALDRLRLVLKGVKASPYAGAFAGIVGSLSKKQQAALAHYATETA